MAMASAAIAADIPKGVYLAEGYTTSSTCGSLSSSLKQGSASVASIEYAGAGQKMTLVNPATSPTGKAGSAMSNVCVSTGNVPSTGLNGASLTFACYEDTASGPASSAEAQLKSKFKVGASHSADIKQVTVTSAVVVGGITACTFTTDATYALQ
jgi:hypothetical protein